MSKISVLGAGSWGTALAILLNNNGHDVTIWGFLKEEVDTLVSTKVNPKLPGVHLDEKISFTNDLKEAVSSANMIVMAVPSPATRSTANSIKDLVSKDQIIISVSKGIEEATLMTQTDILEDVLGADIKVCALSGPSHAEEVAIGLTTCIVAGSKDEEVAKEVQNTFMADNFRVYTSTDTIGMEMGASLKNVIALAAGMCDGVGCGDNAKAALITRGIKEIAALSMAMGGKMETLTGLAGIGDLIVTCESRHSRNRMAGFYIGQGLTYQQAMDKVSMVVEGVYSAKAALKLAEKYQVSVPIIEAVNAVLFKNMIAKDMVTALMTRDKKSEF